MSEALTAQSIVESAWAFTRSRILLTAVELSLFTHIASGHTTLEELVRATGARREGLRAVLDALTCLGFLRQADNRFGLTRISEEFLVEGKQAYLGGIVREVAQEWAAWEHLTDTVRSGVPHREIETRAAGEDFFAAMAEGLHAVSARPARAFSSAIGAGQRWKGIRVLDLGAGSAPWSIAIAAADPTAELTLVDWPAPLAVAAKEAAKAGVSDRISTRPGDLMNLTVEEAGYDLVICGHVLRLFSRDKALELLKKARLSLRPGGRVAIMEFLISQQGAGAYFPYSVALNVLVNTRSGYPYTEQELNEALRTAGFAEAETLTGLAPYPIVMGTR